jgi:hypothetical protein
MALALSSLTVLDRCPITGIENYYNSSPSSKNSIQKFKVSGASKTAIFQYFWKSSTLYLLYIFNNSLLSPISSI